MGAWGVPVSRARGCQRIPAAIEALVAVLTIAYCAAPSDEHGRAGDRVGGGAISAQDVHHFVQAFARWTPADSSCVALEPYWSAATRGLESYASKFDVSHADLCRQLRRRPERYASLAARLPALDSAAARVRDVYAKLAALHPLSNNPSVYFVVGDGISAGTTTRGKHPIILIGMELNNSIANLPRVVAHELVHTQQDFPFFGSMTGGPAFLRGTLLRQSIMEGSANFIASLLMDRPDSNAWAESHEAELWAEFRRDAHSHEYSRWLYNGWNRAALGDRPPDVGYWMGYRIAQSYYEHAADKKKAIADMLLIRDFDRFLADSRYTGPRASGMADSAAARSGSPTKDCPTRAAASACTGSRPRARSTWRPKSPDGACSPGRWT